MQDPHTTRRPRSRTLTALALTALAALTLVQRPWHAAAEEPVAEVPVAPAGQAPRTPHEWLAAMRWIDGAWTGHLGAMAWEAAYTSAQAGERFSINKVMRDGRVVSYEVERFRVHEGTLIMTPFPGGKEAATFTLDPERSTPTRMVFLSPENEFPKQLVYERVDGAHVRIALSGSLDASAPGPRLALKRSASVAGPASGAGERGR